MALPSKRQNSSVNPDKGVYVEMACVMEIRTDSEDPDFEDNPEDMFDFQKRVTHIPDNFCHKDKYTTNQSYFFCIVCNCDLKNLKPLRDHVTGNKHIRKACEFKRTVLGLPNEPQNAPRKKEQKKERPRIDVGQTLEERLRDCGEPAIGLDFITEYTNPRNRKDHPMYTCSLEGCKSAWGTSDDIYNHVKNHKHQKNFFKKLNPDDGRIMGMSKDQLLLKAAEYEEEEGGSDERDYTRIMKNNDYDKYMELRDRPDDWSEKKAKLGIVGARANSNMEPLGKRKRKESEPSQFDEKSWGGWELPTKEQILIDLENGFQTGIKDVRDKVEDFKGQKDDEKYEEIQFFQDTYKKLLSVLSNDNSPVFSSKVRKWESEFDVINGNLVEKVEAEDRSMKEISKLMAELEDEIKLYYSQKNTNKYNNIKQRIRELTDKVQKFKPSSPPNQQQKKTFNARLFALWKEFEDRAENIVEILEREVNPPAPKPDSEKTTSQRRLDMRKEATERYKQSLIGQVRNYLETFRDKFGDEEELNKFSHIIVEKKLLNPEVNAFTKKIETGRSKSWEEFVVSKDTMENVKKYLIQKMNRYTKGEVYRYK